ncbi:MAG: ABC transporter permease [Acidimicrobiia bacterium]|nr:ABC transporter permease [Acidimicrobiia bacterium]
MRLDVAERAAKDRRRGLIGWSIGLAGYMTMIVATWPSVRDSEALVEAIEDYPEALEAFFGGEGMLDFGSPEGYLGAELFSLMVPLLLGIFAIGFGASTLAGEEEQGTLDLLLANPVTRRRVVIEKGLVLLGCVLGLAAVTAASIALVGLTVDLGVGIDRIAAACLGSALLAALHGAVAMLVGAATGSRAAAIGVATAVFAGGYLVFGLSGLVSWLEPADVLTPLYHASSTEPLRYGLPVGNYLLLAGTTVALLVAATWVFERRDLAA